jgi:hypothetical protein
MEKTSEENRRTEQTRKWNGNEVNRATQKKGEEGAEKSRGKKDQKTKVKDWRKERTEHIN